MANTYAVHWTWINHEERAAQPIDLKVKFVSLPEINAINNFIDENSETTQTLNKFGKQYIHTSSIIGAIFEASSFAIFLAIFAVIALKSVEAVNGESVFDED
jgi:hypothetical protein